MRRAGLACRPAGWPARAAPRAQAAWPERPITLVVPFGPGGIADLTARTVAQAMSATLKVPIVVDNKPSAGSIVGSAAVAQAAPDGYTLLLMSNANAVSASLFRKLPFDVQKDFAPIGTLGVFDLALFVCRGSRFKSVARAARRGQGAAGQADARHHRRGQHAAPVGRAVQDAHRHRCC